MLCCLSCLRLLLAVMFLMQLFPSLAKARVPALLPAMVSAACTRGPELAALPACPPAFWERERERRDKELRDRRERGQAADVAAEDKWREAVADKWREQLMAAVADLKTAQVTQHDGSSTQHALCVRARARLEQLYDMANNTYHAGAGMWKV